MFRDNDGKTEDATPAKLAEAAASGNVAISREFTMAFTLLCAAIVAYIFGGVMVNALRETLHDGLSVDVRTRPIYEADIAGAIDELDRPIQHVGVPLVGFMLLLMLITAIAGYGQIGLSFRPKALKVDPNRINPTKNISRLFSFQSVMRTIVSAIKLIVLGTVLVWVLRARLDRFISLYEEQDLKRALELIAETAFLIIVWVSVVVLLIALVDVIYQRWDYKQNLKMSKQEVEDERKRSDGDPFIKGRLREARRELMRQRMMDAIPEADVVITNPTHFAVALAYDRSKHAAPVVLAKGVDEVAFKIRALASENDVAVVEDPPLARALYRSVKVGREIPERFYQAIATVLGHVFRMREGRVA